MAKREQINVELVAWEKREAKRRDGPAARAVSNGGSVSREDFDWACQIYRGTLDAAGIECSAEATTPRTAGCRHA